MTRPFLGVWPGSPTRQTWDDLKTSIPDNRILGYRPRGGFGQFDAPMIQDPVNDITIPFYSTNLNPRTGTGDNRTPVSLVDWAHGRYDDVLRQRAAELIAFAPNVRRIVVEIWSECNVQDDLPSSQPKPPDWSIENWEAAFLHTVSLWRSMGLPRKVWLGTSLAGAQRGFEEYITQGMLAASDFAGYDTYSTGTTFHPLSERTAKFRSYLGDTPCIITESGVDPRQDYVAWFDDASKLAPELEGMFYTDFDNSPKGDYRVGVGSPMHATFATFSSSPIWRRP